MSEHIIIILINALYTRRLVEDYPDVIAYAHQFYQLFSLNDGLNWKSNVFFLCEPKPSTGFQEHHFLSVLGKAFDMLTRSGFAATGLEKHLQVDHIEDFGPERTNCHERLTKWQVNECVHAACIMDIKHAYQQRPRFFKSSFYNGYVLSIFLLFHFIVRLEDFKSGLFWGLLLTRVLCCCCCLASCRVWCFLIAHRCFLVCCCCWGCFSCLRCLVLLMLA